MRRLGISSGNYGLNAPDLLIGRSELKKLCALRPWKAIVALVFDWIVIALAIATGHHFSNIFAYLPAVAIIGGRMHALGVLMHEAAHGRMFKSRFANDWVGDLFAAWPIMLTVGGYRQNHMAHHRHTNTGSDPDWVAKLDDPSFSFPQKARTLVTKAAGYLVAANSIRDLRRILPRLSKNGRHSLHYKLARLSFYLFWALLFYHLGIWKSVFLYWLVPYMTVFFLVQHVRSVAEHFGSMDYSNELTGTRTVKPLFWERWFFAPHNINYHLEHHLYPDVPFYNLPELHRQLIRNPGYRSHAHVTRGYTTGLVRECLA